MYKVRPGPIKGVIYFCTFQVWEVNFAEEPLILGIKKNHGKIEILLLFV